jgi:hypothetical protein
VAAFDESGEAADGEEITNKIPRIADEGKPDGIGRGCKSTLYEMCPIYADFKHFRGAEAKDFRRCRKVSSIMYAKVLSIMPTGDARLTSLFKPKRTRLWQGHTHRPGT